MSGRIQQLDFFGEAADLAPKGVSPAPARPEIVALAEKLPANLRLGTSSWSFPGWADLVYDREYSSAQLAKEGLSAYAQHPLFRTVGIDRTFYGPVPSAALAQYASSVPSDFRFLVKAEEVCTLARFPNHVRYGSRQGQPNPYFLDPSYARDNVVAPFVEGLREKAGPLIFQFPPQDVRVFGGPERFAERLEQFLGALPRGPLYGVEVRNSELLVPAYTKALRNTDTCPVLVVWGEMIDLREQAKRTAALEGPALIVRWMLHPGREYEEARDLYAPFNRLVEEDVPTRKAVAQLCDVASSCGKPVYVIANNKAEGSSPLSILRLAEQLTSLKG